MFQFEFDQANKILRGRFEGRVTDEEMRSFYRLAVEMCERVLPRAAIIDFSAVDDLAVAAETIIELAYSPPALEVDVPEFVIAPTLLHFALSRVFERHAEQTRQNLYVVRDAEQVWTILSISEPHFEPISFG